MVMTCAGGVYGVGDVVGSCEVVVVVTTSLVGPVSTVAVVPSLTFWSSIGSHSNLVDL